MSEREREREREGGEGREKKSDIHACVQTYRQT